MPQTLLAKTHQCVQASPRTFGRCLSTQSMAIASSFQPCRCRVWPTCLKMKETLCIQCVFDPCIYILNISIRDHSWSCVLVTINLSASLSISPQNVYLKIDQHCSSLLHASRCRDQHFYQNQAVVQVECGISIFCMERCGGGEQPDHVLHVMFNFNSHAPLLNHSSTAEPPVPSQLPNLF